MNLLSMQPLLAFLALVSVALIINGILYFSFRYLEKISRFISAIAIVGISLFVILLNYKMSSNVLLIPPSYPISFIVISTLGGFLHLKSGGYSKNAVAAFLLMLSICISAALIHEHFVSFRLWSSLLSLAWWNFPQALAMNILLKAQLLAPPFLIWALKNSQLRPGMDKHLDS